MHLLNEIANHFSEIHESESVDSYLLACSGGLDSVVLFHVMKDLKLSFEVAHCNFNLRGDESDGDEHFVRMMCRDADIPFHCESFDTKKYADDNKLSIQEAARELRYAFFDKICDQRNLQIIATAHHLDDTIETFFMNLLRGTGLSGLKGIPMRRDAIFRPMLTVGRKEIEQYAINQKLQFREDSSNASDKYMRNQLRKLMPKLEEIKPQFRQILQRNMQYFKESDQYLSEKLQADIQKVVNVRDGNVVEIDKDTLMATPHHDYILYEYLAPFGFNESDINDILVGLQKKTNAVYHSKEYELVRERGKLVLRKKIGKIPDNQAFIDNKTTSLLKPLPLAMEVHFEGLRKIPKENSKAFFNLNALKFPLIVRKWRFGDKFQPLGMQGMKKVSDLFADRKVDRLVKEQACVVESAGDIIWVVGYRIDERYKVRDLNGPVFEISMK